MDVGLAAYCYWLLERRLSIQIADSTVYCPFNVQCFGRSQEHDSDSSNQFAMLDLGGVRRLRAHGGPGFQHKHVAWPRGTRRPKSSTFPHIRVELVFILFLECSGRYVISIQPRSILCSWCLKELNQSRLAMASTCLVAAVVPVGRSKIKHSHSMS